MLTALGQYLYNQINYVEDESDFLLGSECLDAYDDAATDSVYTIESRKESAWTRLSYSRKIIQYTEIDSKIKDLDRRVTAAAHVRDKLGQKILVDMSKTQLNVSNAVNNHAEVPHKVMLNMSTHTVSMMRVYNRTNAKIKKCTAQKKEYITQLDLMHKLKFS